MLRKFGIGLFCVAASLSTSIYSSENLSPQLGISIEYELPSNTPQTFTNPMFWAVEANCKISAQDEVNEFLIVALAKKGKLNDMPLTAGESFRMNVYHGQMLRVSADSGAKVEITNLSQHPVKVSCTTA